MALNFNPPSFVRPREYAAPDIGGALDALYNAYLRQRQLGQQDEALKLQRFGQGADLAKQGIDPTSAGLPDNPAWGPLRERFIRDTNLSTQMNAMKMRGEEADIGLKQSQIAENEARAKKYASEAAPGAPGGVVSGKQLPPNTVLSVNEGRAVARILPEIEQAIASNEKSFGPVAGLKRFNPYNEKSNTLDARMRTASQAFGRYMEGGVLRKEDEEKYRKMFPQLGDTPQIAKNKLSIVRRQLAQKYQDDKSALGASGYDVSGLSDLAIPASIFETAKPSGGGKYSGMTKEQKLAELQRQLSGGQ